MSNNSQFAPRHPGPVQLWALRRVFIVTEQQVHLAGGRHDLIELVTAALRSGEIRARGLCDGEQAIRWITPAEWKDLRIENEPSPLFEVLGPPNPVVRRLDATPGSGDPPAITQVCLDAGQVQAWLTRVRPTLKKPNRPMAKPWATAPAPVKRLSSKVVLEREVDRVRAAGEIFPTITELSRTLRQRLLDLNKRDKRVFPLKTRSIENRLRDYTLWPIK